MEWKDEFSTGIERLDEQHRMLFQMTGDFHLALEEGRGERTYGLLLGLLSEYSLAHFEFEEKCMERHRCPVAEQNRAAHQGFLRMLGDFRLRHESRGYRVEDAHELIDALERWLEGHICRIDSRLRASVNEGGAV